MVKINMCNIMIINNGNRTEWNLFRSVIIRVIDRSKRLRSGDPTCQSWAWLQTEFDNTCKVLSPVTHKSANFWKQRIHFGKIYLVETMPKVKNSSILGISQFFLRIRGCFYSYCDQLCDWWIWLKNEVWLAATGVRLQSTVLLQLLIMISEE